MEKGLIIGFDLAKGESKSTCSLIVAEPLQKQAMQIINEFQGEEEKQIYMILTGEKDLRQCEIRKRVFEYPDIYNSIYDHVYENVTKKILEELMQYTFFEDGQKILVLDKEKIKQKYKVQNVIFEEEDVEHG